ncbi:helix-turn-helix domain-containing protein [Schinkia azotoformans]|uniref:helix-turn-helix domain-containing protein n=1 Tax=Schinkia azotoformans TaxID=1454 RepID=UPI002DBBB542|nr:helix-turn-helix transcriptional regulator [Schinkia azotoformans]MEC1786067.1 helix-turn-helix transcriptional regulator [Schinkia azotoformans]MED4420103.1 helix-turn-helix transcriptional regulator [Schinkia azotoformans]
MTKLKRLRRLSDITQEELAEKLNVTQAYLSMIENGKRKPSKQVQQKIDEIFDLSLKYID